MANDRDAAEDWVEIRRFDDAIPAEMTRDFLRDHGLAVRMRGNVGGTALLNRFNTVMDIRLDVGRHDLESAREALQAMEAGDAVEQPFRGRSPKTKEEEAAYVPPRKTAAAMILGFLLPIGSGHFYARHGAAGSILLAGCRSSRPSSSAGARAHFTSQAFRSSARRSCRATPFFRSNGGFAHVFRGEWSADYDGVREQAQRSGQPDYPVHRGGRYGA
jgi:hypothetical protein